MRSGSGCSAMFLAIRPLGARVLLPFLLVAYLAPFLAAPERVAAGRPRARRGARAATVSRR